MKRFFCLLLALCLLIPAALAAPGDANDPVVSQSYLTGVFHPSLTAALHKTAAASLGQIYGARFLSLAEAVGRRNLAAEQANTAIRRDDGALLLKRGDVLTLQPGTKVLISAGKCTSSEAHLIDVTGGWRVSASAALRTGALYMKDDSATGGLSVTSETATLTITGPYTLAVSASPDFASRADALHEMDLFRGSSIGYALESTASRAQGLVMFLRIMGLEDEALACTAGHPFTDVPPSHWAYRYVAYAYQNGYTKGATATTFNPSGTISAKNYIAFMVRALHYDEGAQFQYSTLLTDCVTLGLFTRAEVNTVTNGAFTRGRMAYLSYYSLFGTDQSTGTMLLDQLVKSGAVTQTAADRAICQVVGTRIA